MAAYIGLSFDEMNLAENVGEYQAVISREDIERYFRNSGCTFNQDPAAPRLFVPPPMCYALTLRAIFHSRIPVDGPILVAHELECLEKIFEGDLITVKVIIKDKWIRNERKYVVFDFRIEDSRQRTCVVDSMRVIWPQ